MTAESNGLQWKSFIRVLLSLGLLLGLVAYVDHVRLLASIEKADPLILLASFVLTPVQGVFESGRLKIVFATFRLSYLDSVRLFFMGMFFGNFMPGSIGADLYQIYHMHTIRPGLLRPVSLSIFLRLNGFFINIVMAAVAVLLGSRVWLSGVDLDLDYLVLPAWASPGLVAFASLMVVLIASRWGRKHVRSLYEKAGSLYPEISASVKSLTTNQHISIAVLGVFVVLSRVAAVYVLVWAFGTSIGGLEMVFIVTVTTLAALLPIGVGGLGVREISLTALLVGFGVAPSEAVAIALVGRFFIWVLSLAGGVWFVLYRSRSKTIKGQNS